MPFRIPIHFTEEDPPFVTATVFLPEKGTMAKADFLVDTGASDLFLSEVCTNELGVQLKAIRRSRLSFGGAGGRVGTFEIENLALIIPTEGEVSWEVHLDSAHVIQNPVRKKGEIIIGIPNLIGRAFMQRHGLILHMDFGRRLAYLEAPD